KLILHLYLLAGQYKIITPDKPVIGVIGKGVILPCQLTIKIIPERLLVHWVFTGHSKKIHVTTYGGKNSRNPVHEDETYRGRTNFFWSEFNKGNVSLHLKNVTVSDKGEYTCSVFFENWYDEAVVDLVVAGEWNGRHLLSPCLYHFPKFPITVDPDCRVLELQVPGTPDVESSASEPAGPNAPSTVPVLLGKEGFAAGKHYWEVEVGQQHDWVLGVLREKGREEEEGTLPGEDFWALHRSQGEIFSSKGDHRIAKQQAGNSVIGVLLDLEEGQVNFYDAEQMGVMVRMPLRLGKEPAEMFYPFLSKREGTLTPLIRPLVGKFKVGRRVKRDIVFSKKVLTFGRVLSTPCFSASLWWVDPGYQPSPSRDVHSLLPQEIT
uniref:Uncharacterized protein n=1 Tax=Buteo japonicus TaxID=224669 RepID=A0A8B9Z2P0_9AVES